MVAGNNCFIAKAISSLDRVATSDCHACISSIFFLYSLAIYRVIDIVIN